MWKKNYNLFYAHTHRVTTCTSKVCDKWKENWLWNLSMNNKQLQGLSTSLSSWC